MTKRIWRATAFAVVVVVGLIAPARAGEVHDASGEMAQDSLALPEEPVDLATLPERPRPLLELGDPYLAPTRLFQGWTLPTGAVWQPSVLAWGILRTAVQGERGRATDLAQWANRLDLFGQLSLTPTERFVIGVEALQDGTDYAGYRLGVDGADAAFVGGSEVNVRTLFFEGDVGELFPRLDRDTIWPLDLGFMVGRVPVTFQDGFLIEDRMTGFGLVQNSILAPKTSNLRLSIVTAWDDVNRGDNTSGGDTRLAGLFTELDGEASTWAVDAVYVNGKNHTDGIFGGVSMIRRIHDRWNLTARLLGSRALGDDDDAAVGNGLLGVLALSVAPHGTHDVAYLNVVGAAGRYTAAAREFDRGGPLARVGILFEAPAIGSIAAPLANDADRVYGGALGYQRFFADGRRQVVLEVAGRSRFGSWRDRAAAAGLRLQQALGRRLVLRLDAYVGSEREEGGFAGARSELLVKF